MKICIYSIQTHILPLQNIIYLLFHYHSCIINNLPPITFADGSILRAAVLIIQNNLITSASSNTRNWRLADMVAQRLEPEWHLSHLDWRYISTLESMAKQTALLLLFQSWSRCISRASWSGMFRNGSGRDDVVAVLLDFFKAVAAAVASADAWIHGWHLSMTEYVVQWILISLP